MELIRTIMMHVIVLVFFTAILDVLLPNSSFRDYIKMTMGLLVVLTLLQPIVQLLQPERLAALQWELNRAQQIIQAEEDWQ